MLARFTAGRVWGRCRGRPAVRSATVRRRQKMAVLLGRPRQPAVRPSSAPGRHTRSRFFMKSSLAPNEAVKEALVRDRASLPRRWAREAHVPEVSDERLLRRTTCIRAAPARWAGVCNLAAAPRAVDAGTACRAPVPGLVSSARGARVGRRAGLGAARSAKLAADVGPRGAVLAALAAAGHAPAGTTGDAATVSDGSRGLKTGDAAMTPDDSRLQAESGGLKERGRARRRCCGCGARPPACRPRRRPAGNTATAGSVAPFMLAGVGAGGEWRAAVTRWGTS